MNGWENLMRASQSTVQNLKGTSEELVYNDEYNRILLDLIADALRSLPTSQQ